MNINEVKRLLELYYAGETTPEQERSLERWAAEAGAVPPELEADRRMLAAMGAARMPQGLEQRMEAAIDRLERRPRRRRLTMWLSGAAACLLLAVGAFTLGRPQPAAQQQLSREEATLLAENSLRLLATTLNRGATDAAMAGETLGETTRKTIETLNNSIATR